MGQTADGHVLDIRTIGDLMDALKESDLHRFLEGMVKKSDPEGLAVLRKLPITNAHISYLCMSIATEVRSNLHTTPMEQRDAIVAKAQQFLDLLYGKVEAQGISDRTIQVPI